MTLHRGDCLDVLPSLAENSLSACITDPPYHLSEVPHVKRGGFGGQRSEERKSARRGFMGKQWDGGDIAFRPELWAQVLRVLKPGAHLLAFSGTRTYHRMACAIEDAGFEIRDQIGWAYGSGFPKSHDVSKGIDRAAGARKVIGSYRRGLAMHPGNEGADNWRDNYTGEVEITAPATPEAEQWKGWGTALKPAWEPIVLARKPISESSIAANVLKWGTGALNIDACRVGVSDHSAAYNNAYTNHEHTNGQSKRTRRTENPASSGSPHGGREFHPANEASNVRSGRELLGSQDDCHSGHYSDDGLSRRDGEGGLDAAAQSGDADRFPGPDNARGHNRDCPSNSLPTHNIDATKVQGRWPANLIHDGSEEVVEGFPESVSSGDPNRFQNTNGGWASKAYGNQVAIGGDSGSAARFFYTAKADTDDRLGSKHPTVKPLDLMQYLTRLVTPKAGVVLDPFAGTGTTGEAAWREGFRAVLIEREAEYQADIAKRMGLCLAGPDERRAKSIKQESLQGLPLFQEG